MRLAAWPRVLRVSRSTVIAVAVVCALLGAASAATWTYTGPELDEGLTLVYPTLMLHHEVPFKDFQSSYGPGTYLPLAAAYDVFGPSVSVERAMGVGYRLAVLLALLALMWPLGRVMATAGVSVAMMAMLPTVKPQAPVAYGWYLGLACVLWALWFVRAGLQNSSARPDKTRMGSSHLWLLGTGGLLCGFAMSTRPELGFAGLLGLAVVLWKGGIPGFAAVTAGLAIGVSPLIWDGFAAGWANLWRFGVQARLHQLPLSGYVFPAGIGYVALLAGAGLLVGWAAVRTRRRLGSTPEANTWLALTIVGLLMVAQTWQRADPQHFAFAAPVAIGLLPWALSRRRPAERLLKAVPVLAAVAITLSVIPVLRNPSSFLHSRGRTYPVGFGSSLVIQPTLNWVDAHVVPGSTVFVGPRQLQWAFWTETEFYYLLPQLKPVDFYLEMGAGDDYPVFTQRLMAGLRKSDVLILQNLPIKLFLTDIWPKARIGSPAPNRLVHRLFRVAFKNSAYTVLVRRSKPKLRPLASST